MKYIDIFNKAAIVKHIPLIFEGRKLPKGMNSSVVLMRIQYDKYIEEFNKDMQKIANELKPQGYDEKCSKIEKMNDIFERKSKIEKGESLDELKYPSETEIKEAENIKETEAKFLKEKEELDLEYSKAYSEKMQQEIDIKERVFSEEELDEIVDLIGVEGSISINNKDVPKEQFINTIAILFT